MARSAATPKSLKVTKKIKPKVTRTEQYLINLKYMGNEPEYTGPLSDLEYSSALTWYNYMCTKSDARSYLETYLKAASRLDELRLIKTLPDSRLIDHPCWIARMLTRGLKLKQRSIDHMNKKITEMLVTSIKLDKEETKLQEPDEKKVVNIQDRIREKTSNYIGMYDEELDREGWTIDTYAWLQKNEVPPTMASKFIEYYEPIALEAVELTTKDCDPQLREGYKSLSKDQLKQRATFYTTLIADVTRYVTNTKLKNFKYMKDCKDLKLTSVSVDRLIGAQEAYLYNTKYHTLSVLYALDRGGLDVSGTTLKKYNEETSGTYRIGLKKAVTTLESILTGGKRLVAKTLGEFKKQDTCQDRSSEHTIVLKLT